MVDFTDSQLIAKLGEKISNMCKSIGEVDKDGTNKHSGYDYISSDNLVGHIRMNLSPNRLAVFPELGDIEEKSTTQENAAGKKLYWTKTTVKMKFEIVDTETGFVKIFDWTGSDQDTGGKSLGQAITECTKRFYSKLFQVSSKEDKDPDSNTGNMPTDDQGQEPKKTESEAMMDNLKPKDNPVDPEPEPSLFPWSEMLKNIVALPEYGTAIQALLKSKEFEPEDMRSEIEADAQIVYEAIVKTKGFEDSETQPDDEIDQHF